MRLDKFLEEKKFSKKQVKKLFKEKQILVDGKFPLSLGANIDPYYQKIHVEGQILTGAKHLYILFHKPKGVVTANSDKKEKTVMDFLPQMWREKLRFSGRLDKETEGLVFLTDNGLLNYRLHQDKFTVKKVYYVQTKEALEQTDIKKVKDGLVIDIKTKLEPGILQILTPHSAYITITQGKFHQVKKMFLSLGKKVTYLKRIQIDELLLPENLEVGKWQELQEEDFEKIRKFFY